MYFLNIMQNVCFVYTRTRLLRIYEYTRHSFQNIVDLESMILGKILYQNYFE